MNFSSYSPIKRLFSSLQKEINDLHVDDLLLQHKSICWAPVVDIKSVDGSYVVHADLPGIDPKDINVRVDGNLLIIDGERNEEKISKDSYYTRSERFTGKFHRQFTLPVDVDADKIVAKSKNGLLELTMPKVDSRKQEIKRIEVRTI